MLMVPTSYVRHNQIKSATQKRFPSIGLRRLVLRKLVIIMKQSKYSGTYIQARFT